MTPEFSRLKSTDVEFEVGVAGTSQLPQRVSVLVENDGISLCFTASQKENGMWGATISNLDRLFKTGPVTFSINVLLNDKLFVPYKDQAFLIDDENVSVTVVGAEKNIMAQPTEKSVPVMQPVNTEIPSTNNTSIVLPIKQEAVQPVVQQPVKAPLALLKTISPAKQTKAAPLSAPTMVAPKFTAESAESVTVPRSSFSLKRTKIVQE